MIEKKMSLQIAGKSITLNLGVNWFFEFYQKDSGYDLIENPAVNVDDIKSIRLFEMLQSMIWAGYQTECAVNKVPTELTKEDIKHFIMSMDEAGASVVLFDLFACRLGKTVEELKKVQPQAEEQAAA